MYDSWLWTYNVSDLWVVPTLITRTNPMFFFHYDWNLKECSQLNFYRSQNPTMPSLENSNASYLTHLLSKTLSPHPDSSGSHDPITALCWIFFLRNPKTISGSLRFFTVTPGRRTIWSLDVTAKIPSERCSHRTREHPKINEKDVASCQGHVI